MRRLQESVRALACEFAFWNDRSTTGSSRLSAMKLYLLALLLACAACEQENFTGCSLVAAAPTGDPATDHANVQLALSSVEAGTSDNPFVVCMRKGTYRFADELDLSFVKHIEIRGSTMDEGTAFDFRPQTRGSYGLQVT